MKSETTITLMNVLRKGKENAVPRKELCERTGWDDRKMRYYAAQARLEGVCIANDMDGRGYYIPTKSDEFRRQIARVRSRLAAISKELKPLQMELDELEGQLTLGFSKGDGEIV